MTEMLIMSIDPQFRMQVRDECIKQEDGEYEVTFKKLIELNKNNSKHASSIKKIESLVTELKRQSSGAEPVIFYPRAEVYDEYRQKRNFNNTRFPVEGEIPAGTYVPPGIPVAVFQGNFYPDYSTDGYTLGASYYLNYFGNVNENYAWENDLWVVGYGEDCSSGNLVSAPEPVVNPARVQGQSEKGMIIQCTNLNGIEHWTSGKLEFKYTVLNSSGAVVLGPLTPGRVKRKHFRDLKWYDYNMFIGNWNTSTFGNWMYENWIEEDGGQSNSYTISQGPPAGQTCCAISTTIPSKNKDDALGTATIQFSDPITQVYNISMAKVKRKN